MTGRILIIGATSGIGACAVSEAAARGQSVRAFARSADQITPTDLIDPMPGDALSDDDIRRALDGCTAVIQALGVKERLSMLWQEETLFSRATSVLLPEMQAAGVSRLITVTGIGAGRSRSALSSLERLAQQAVLGRPYADKDRQEAMIMDSPLDWTIVRPTLLTNGASRTPAQVLDDPAQWRNGMVTRQQVARVLLDLVEQGTHIRSDVVVTR